MIWKGLWVFYGAMNLLAFCLYGMDKRRAQHGQWRISEKALLTATWLMGGVGAWLAMRVFRHKTQHRVFTVSVPIAAILSIVVMALAAAKMMNIF